MHCNCDLTMCERLPDDLLMTCTLGTLQRVVGGQHREQKHYKSPKSSKGQRVRRRMNCWNCLCIFFFPHSKLKYLGFTWYLALLLEWFSILRSDSLGFREWHEWVSSFLMCRCWVQIWTWSRGNQLACALTIDWQILTQVAYFCWSGL